MSNSPLKGQMQARFHELRSEIDTIEAKAAPLRAERDQLVNSIPHDKIRSLEETYAEIEKPLFAMKNELGSIARFLHDPETGKSDTGIATKPKAKT